MFNRHQKTDRFDISKTHPDARLRDIPKEIKAQLAHRLAEQRVVQHVPADQSGAHLEQNPWRVLSIDGENDNPTSIATITQTTSSIDDGQRVFNEKITTERISKLIGLKPGKLNKNKAVLVISENYGLALDPSPQIIPFHNVPKRLAELKNLNRGSNPRILRRGLLIRISNWPGKEGVWRIFSTKAPAYLDLAKLDVITMESKGERYWRQVSVTSLLKKNALEILHPPLTGINPDD